MDLIIFVLLTTISLHQCLSFEVLVRGSLPRYSVTGEQCVSSKYCEGGRKCIATANILAKTPCQGSADCVCIPELLQACNSSQECQSREACGSIPQFPSPVCISAVILSFSPDATELQGKESRPEVSDSVGLSFYPCKVGDSCKGTRQCLSDNGPDGPVGCQDGANCQCYPSIPEFCSDSTSCETGEVCADAGGALLCIAADVVAATTSLSPVESLPGLVPVPTVSSTASGGAESTTSTGLMEPGQEPTQSNETQSGVGTSIGDNATTTEGAGISSASPPVNGDNGFSVSPSSSTPSVSVVQESVRPSVSATFSASPIPSASVSPTASANLSASPSISQVSSGTDGAVSSGRCVDAEALGHFQSDELVFSHHSLASVLCDQNGSCATAGHIVVWKGTAMMMRSYCAEVGGCAQRILEVNSPRMRMGLRVSSKTNELEYTAFSARFETAGEEKILQLAVRVGL